MDYNLELKMLYKTFLPPRQALKAPFQKFTMDANRFELDLADPDIDRKMEYVIALSLSYERSTSRDNMFFMTRNDITKDMEYESVEVPIFLYDSFICAFDRHRFYKPSEIYSDTVRVPEYEPLAFAKIEEGAILKQEFVDEWDKFNRFIPTYYTRFLRKSPFLLWWKEN